MFVEEVSETVSEMIKEGKGQDDIFEYLHKS